jgi:large subunit ribosomal protein L1
LPKGLGKTVRVIVFADGDKAEAARGAGADAVGAGDLADKINGGWMDFDIVIASPDMMKHVGKLGKVLGPQGKMPSPKSGTVTADVGAAVREFKAGKVEFRTDAGGNVHAAVGKRSFKVEDLEANLRAFLDHLSAMRPPSVKGQFVRKVSVSTTMGPGAWINYGAQTTNA